MKTHLYLKLLVIISFLGCTEKKEVYTSNNIIPIPKTVIPVNEEFTLSNATSFQYDSQVREVAIFFAEILKYKYDIDLKTENSNSKIELKLSNTIQNDEGYRLEINENNIVIAAKNKKGAFYAVQSLLQILPPSSASSEIVLEGVRIEDAPRFSYRGMHLDVARHFFPVTFIKKYIDLMAMLKMNTFHWHLTEDQGWRIEIKQYPKLQEIAAYRKETLLGHYSDKPHQFDGKKYGGYYTQKEIKEIVAYASKRNITIIPEIEMPGHSQAAIAAYPELGCTGEQIEVATKWGVFEDIYCTKENTFTFLENVIDEVVALFPGKYIHIGGDEAPKSRWKNCLSCQNRIKKEGLKDEYELQSYFITRMEKYINSKGKQIIGWDEILEGGLAPNATVMSWRGFNGAIEAAKQGHDVILTPGSHCYFDHYQSDNENEPLAIGGFLPLEKVYAFNPIPEELSREESKYVIGAQGNVWTEYISTPEKVEYMAYPRAVALSEVVWSEPENRNYTNFIERFESFRKRLDLMNVNYANHLYKVEGNVSTIDDKMYFNLTTTTNNKIFYSLNSSKLNNEFVSPILLDSTTVINAAIFDSKGEQKGNIFSQKIDLHKGVKAKVSLNTPAHDSYNAGGTRALHNGVIGDSKRYGDKEWLGFWGDDIEITYHFKTPERINSISTRFHNGNGQWIYAPENIFIQFNNQEKRQFAIKNSKNLLQNFTANFSEEDISSIKITIPSYGKIPEGKQGAGNKAWTFIDEIIIK